MDGFNLKGRIAERRQTELRPLVERRGGEERRKPAWLRRMDEQGLPNKDYSGQVKVAA